MSLASQTRTLITMPASAKRGDIIDIRILVQHPMETGYRRGSEGAILKRDLIRRFEVYFVNARTATPALAFAADLFAAVSANPYIAFSYRAEESGAFKFRWVGDHGFVHEELRAIGVTA
jgi:sulfur-oxidizing protein SoxZ